VVAAEPFAVAFKECTSQLAAPELAVVERKEVARVIDADAPQGEASLALGFEVETVDLARHLAVEVGIPLEPQAWPSRPGVAVAIVVIEYF
jgi:hypothetical protein